MDEFLWLVYSDDEGGYRMEIFEFKSYDDLPPFLNLELVAKVLGMSSFSGYELIHEPDIPVLRVGSRTVVPKEKLIQWVEEHTGSAG